MKQIERKRIQGNIGSRMKTLQKIFFPQLKQKQNKTKS